LESHFEKLIRIYEAAPINVWFKPKLLIPAKGQAEIRGDVRPDFFHAGNAVHGATYFKMLDDAAYFAVQSLVTDFFIVTTSFNIHFLRPVTSGELLARGRIVQNAKRLFVAEATLTNGNGKEVGRGSGTFVPSTTALDASIGY
jgi:uncharacterized protein (TIGR00369 family)